MVSSLHRDGERDRQDNRNDENGRDIIDELLPKGPISAPHN